MRTIIAVLTLCLALPVRAELTKSQKDQILEASRECFQIDYDLTIQAKLDKEKKPKTADPFSARKAALMEFISKTQQLVMQPFLKNEKKSVALIEQLSKNLGALKVTVSKTSKTTPTLLKKLSDVCTLARDLIYATDSQSEFED